jgi:hypothetical protein
LKRFARLLSALLIALLAYAAAGEGACAAEGMAAGDLTTVTAPHDADSHQVPDKGCSHSCVHGHHHIDSAPMAGARFAHPDAEREIVREASLMPHAHRPGSLDRPPRL